MVPVELEVPAAWDAVDPCVVHKSRAQLEEWSSRLIMLLDGTGGPFSSCPVLRSDFTDVFSPKEGVREGWAACLESTVLISDNENFVTTARRSSRAHPVGQCWDLWHQYWDAVEAHEAAMILKVESHVSEWFLWCPNPVLLSGCCSQHAVCLCFKFFFCDALSGMVHLHHGSVC